MKKLLYIFLVLPLLAQGQNPIPYKGTGFIYFTDSVEMQNYTPLNLTGSEEAILRRNSTSTNPHENRYFQWKGPVLKWVEFLPGGNAGNGGTVFRTSNVTPTTANTFPTGVAYKANDVIFYLRNGSVGFRNSGNTAWVKTTLDNGFNVPSGLRVTIPNTPPFYVPNLNKGNAFNINAVGDVTVSVPDSIDFQSIGEVFTFNIVNTTEDVVRVDFSSIGFKNKAQGAAVGEPVDSILLSPFDAVMVPFEVVNIGELIVLQTHADWNRNWAYNYVDAALDTISGGCFDTSFVSNDSVFVRICGVDYFTGSNNVNGPSIPLNEVAFGTGTGLTSDSSLIFDPTTKKLTARTTNVSRTELITGSFPKTSVTNSSNGWAGNDMFGYSNSNAYTYTFSHKGRGTEDSPLPLISGDRIYLHDIRGQYNTTIGTGAGCALGGFFYSATGNFSGSSTPYKMEYWTRPRTATPNINTFLGGSLVAFSVQDSGEFAINQITSATNNYAGFPPVRVLYPSSTGEVKATLPDSLLVTNPQTNSGLVTLRTALRQLKTMAPGSGTVTSVNASGGSTGLTFSGGPITTSGTLTLGGVLNIANGGTGSSTQTWWDLTTNQISAGVKRTTGGLLVGSTLPITGVNFGQTDGGYYYNGPITTAWSETNFVNTAALTVYNHQNGGKQSTYLVAHGNDIGNIGSRFLFGTRVNGSTGNVTFPHVIDGLQNLFGNAVGGGGQPVCILGKLGLEDGANSWSTEATTTAGGQYEISFNGALQAYLVQGGGGVWVPSDRRLKNNVKTLSISQLAKELNAVTYYYKTDKKKERPQIGFIAQDVEKVFPAAVHKSRDGKLAVNYNMMAAAAWQLGYDNSEEIETLKAENLELHKRLEALEQQAGIIPKTKMGFLKRWFGRY